MVQSTNHLGTYYWSNNLETKTKYPKNFSLHILFLDFKIFSSKKINTNVLLSDYFGVWFNLYYLCSIAILKKINENLKNSDIIWTN